MTRPDISVKTIRFLFAVDSPATQKRIKNQPGLNKSAVGLLVQNIYNHYSIRGDVVINRVVLDICVISCQHLSLHFHQRLHSALVKLFMQLEAITRNAPVPVANVEHNAEPHADIPLLAQAVACLQPAGLPAPEPDIPAARLYSLLEQVVNARSGANPTADIKTFSPHPGANSRLTPQHVEMMALHYLLLENEGVHWLSQNSLPQAMRDTLAAAMVRREVAPALLLHCIASLEALPQAQARAVAGRWVIPLWRYPGMTQAVQQQAGRGAATQAARYLASLLPGRAAMPSSVTDVAASRAVAYAEQHTSNALGSRQDEQTTPAFARQPRHGARPRPVYASGEVQSAPGLPVTNAGIVLFWPLFTPWFTTLGLMEEKQFVSEEARWQAVVAMDWLVWEQETPAVERLVVNQFLCGLPLSEPPAALAPLSTELRQRTLAWVEAISAQLAAFEKMSLNDIRQLFLQRPGELFADLAPATLNIEPQPFDLLLTKWPWPLNLAYFPWFDVPLMIEWPGSEPAGARL
ncbi:contractile injection system tape measure protein [Kosakonia cowanii]|uniref:contractile injection system tape measure protein n=1 Tax=Kosakonia cowanii TaxID=208223 RepID=UPI0028A6A215|nr:contractile injection system tape measure protein [Kosakonia cowanii]